MVDCCDRRLIILSSSEGSIARRGIHMHRVLRGIAELPACDCEVPAARNPICRSSATRRSSQRASQRSDTKEAVYMYGSRAMSLQDTGTGCHQAGRIVAKSSRRENRACPPQSTVQRKRQDVTF
ncbi:hypothetical protein MRB53_039554 [Persea americana]|nr:hypothetical protein MRB53_039554 [Persea americana]